MGNISSRPDDGSALYFKDQARLSLEALTISNSRRKVTLHIAPNTFPATRLSVRRDPGDDAPVEYIQDPEAATPLFLLKLDNADDLNFQFSFVTRQTLGIQPGALAPNTTNNSSNIDTSITGLTFAYASNPKELENLVTREFHADPNLHKNSNVQLIGDYSTKGNVAIHFDWSWTWRPSKGSEDRGGGWRNSCSFLEYDQRAHKLNPLASFSFWVHNNQRNMARSPVTSPYLELPMPVRKRIISAQSYQSQTSDSETGGDIQGPPSPIEPNLDLGSTTPTATNPLSRIVDVSCQRPGEDMSAVDDGPLFRATMKALEQKTGSMRTQMKKVLKKAEAAQQAQVECNQAMKGLLTALKEASSSNASAIKPALDHYFDQIAQQILQYETQNSIHLQKQIIEPLSKLYNLDIKQAESKKKDFEEESRDYYAYVSRYLGQRQDSLKEKKRIDSDSKYQSKRRDFELKRFDYSSFMQDLHGGRKEQELLSHLTKYADGQARSFLATARKVEELTPELNALVREVSETDKEYKFQRTEREEKRRNLEKLSASYTEPEILSHSISNSMAASSQNGYNSYTSDTDLGRANSAGSQLGRSTSGKTAATLSPSNSVLQPSSGGAYSTSTGVPAVSPGQNRFRGIRDLEEKDVNTAILDKLASGEQRKEGLLWALSRPGSHMDAKGINKQAWHKFWIVLDQGKLSEYSNWKQKLDLHMEPIDLRMASVRMARDADRRFCFEVITPQFKRIYQATSEDDMTTWILAINNALQSAVEGRGVPTTPSTAKGDSSGRDIGSALTGKSSSHSGLHGYNTRPELNGVGRRITVGARPSYLRTTSNSYEDNPSKFLQQLREVDQGNTWCADCGSNSKVEWTSINFGIILCIECSGIHRSLGTHISKVRSLTLDTMSFTNDIVEVLLQVGNRVSNMVWEARLDPASKPTAQSNREQRLRFITLKYVERAFVQPISSTLSHYSTADETLLASIKKNDIQGVLYGIALRGNVNTGDRSRNTHAVFLALAAADPAAPAASTGAGSPNSRGSTTPTKSKAFPIAELLIQNGAEVPAQLPAIPMSAAAQSYIEQRTARSVAAQASGDILGPLPVMKGIGVGTAMPGPAEKDKESRLQKRGSAGARLAGRVAALGAER